MNTYPNIVSITKEELVNYPYQSFCGKIHLVDRQKDVAKAVAYLSSKSVLGFDTETRPSFQKGVKYQVALLQLSDETDAFLFRLNKIGLPQEVADLLANKDICKVGVAIHDDIKGLQKRTTFAPQNFVDLQTIAKELEINAMGLRTLTPIVLGFKISKREQISNWENVFLYKSQKVYAATDAWVSLKIFQELQPYRK